MTDMYNSIKKQRLIINFNHVSVTSAALLSLIGAFMVLTTMSITSRISRLSSPQDNINNDLLYIATSGNGNNYNNVLMNEPGSIVQPDHRKPQSVDETEQQSNTMITTSESDIQETAGSDSCSGRRVYMYDMPAEFNSWIEEHCANDIVPWLNFCRHFANQGFGQLANGSEYATNSSSNSWADWYKSDPYMLEVIFHRQMEAYECRTLDAADADAVFIPYYSGLDELRFLYGKNTTERSAHGEPLLRWLEAPEQRATWRRRGGHDHFMVMGRTAWDFTRPLDAPTDAWGTSLAVLPALQNVTALFLERRGWWPGQEEVVQEQAIPYPTAFHPRSKKSLRRWQKRLSRRDAEPRRFLFAFVGSARPAKVHSGCNSCNMRNAVMQQCMAAANASSTAGSTCTILDCSKIKCAHNPLPIANALLHADFCLQPPGDTATRRSTFDGILSGCIPVFFDSASAYTQYTWHLPADPATYSVDLTALPYEELLEDPLLVHRHLASIPRDQVARMRSVIVNDVIPRILYAWPGSGLRHDAFHVAVDAILRRSLEHSSKHLA